MTIIMTVKALKFPMLLFIRLYPARRQVLLFCASIITASLTASSRRQHLLAGVSNFTPINMSTA